jgi:cytidylate kinase
MSAGDPARFRSAQASLPARATHRGGQEVTRNTAGRRINIAICGLSAAGKTTHAKLLAEELGYRYVSGTATLARMLGVEPTEDPPRWEEIADAIGRLRSDEVDNQLESRLLELAGEDTGQVFDVWGLPWTSADPGLARLWIESTPRSRATKCFVSQGLSAGARTLSECQTFINDKDLANRALFKRTQNFDLFVDHDVFQIVLDNTQFIAKPSLEAARRGISAFAPFVRRSIDAFRGVGGRKELVDLESTCGFPRPVALRLETS